MISINFKKADIPIPVESLVRPSIKSGLYYREITVL